MEPEDHHFAEYLGYLRVERGLAENTILAYQRDLQKLAHQAGQLQLSWREMERRDLVLILGRLKENGDSEATISRFVSVLKGYFRFLQREGLLASDPTAYLETR